MPILKVTVYDTSDHKRKKLICASDPATLPEARKAFAAVVTRFDTLDKIRASSSRSSWTSSARSPARTTRTRTGPPAKTSPKVPDMPQFAGSGSPDTLPESP